MHGSSLRRARTRVAFALLAVAMSSVAALNGPLAHASPAVTLSTSAATVAPGATVDLTASMPVVDAGTVAQEIVQELDPTRVKLTSAADITYPSGWTLSYSFDNGSTWTTTTPSSASGSATSWDRVTTVKAMGPLVSAGVDNGRQVAEATVSDSTALAPASLQVSTGDGWQVFFDADRTRAFNVYHHETQGKIDCWLISTGERCAGFPFQWGGASQNAALARVVGSNIWVQGTGGLWCVDISAVLANTTNAIGGGSPALCSVPGATTPGQVPLAAGRLFTWFAGGSTAGDTGETRLYALDPKTNPARVYCVDTATKTSCGNFSSRAAGNTAIAAENATLIRWGDRLYVNVQGNTTDVSCVLISTGGFCPGWTSAWDAYAFDPYATNGKLFELPDSSGNIRAICYQTIYLTRYQSTSPLYAQCWDANGTRFSADQVNFPRFTYALDLGTYASPVTQGSRVYFGNGTYNSSNGQILCYDAAANGGAGGRCNGDSSNFFTLNYTATPDPLIENCMWVTQHSSPVIRSFNQLTGAQGCGALVPPTSRSPDRPPFLVWVAQPPQPSDPGAPSSYILR